MKALALTIVAACGLFAVQDPTQGPPPVTITEQHRWLEQLVGEWTATSEMRMAEGAEPMTAETTESMRSLGGLWVVGEGKGKVMGRDMTTMLTIGFDPAQNAFVGSWVDTMQTHMWRYRGTLDAAKKVLTLEAEGPSWTDPKQTALYRDAIEIVSKDHKRMTSSVKQGESWVQFMTVDYRRK